MGFPLVGRDEELTELQTCIKDAAAGHGSLVLVGGESGIGKSALVREAFRGGKVPVCFGRCPGPDETPPFGPWLAVVRSLRGSDPASDSRLPKPFGRVSGDWRISDIAAELFRWLGALRRSVCVVIEDIQWADAESLQLLRHLAPRLASSSVLIVATYRNDELDRSHPLWSLLPELHRHGVHRLTLRRLRTDDVVQLTAYAMPGSPGVTRIAQYLHERTAGHPFFVCELLSANRTDRGDHDELPLPETIQQAIDQRMRPLSPSAETVLEIAAVVGERFGFDLLSEVAGMEPSVLDGAMGEAMSLHLIRSAAANGDTFAFDHALIREQVLQRLVGYRRRGLHLRIAEALLRRSTVEADVIGFHLYRAGDNRAPKYLKQAGNAALRVGAFAQAASRYEQALEAYTGKDDAAESLRAEILLMYGVACLNTVQGKAMTSWRQASELAERIGDGPLSVWAQHMMALWHYRNGDRECLDLMERVQELQERWLDSDRYQALEVQLYGEHCGLPRIVGHRALALTKAGREDEARALIELLKRRATPRYRRDGLLHIEYWHAILTGQMELSVDLGGLVTDHAVQQGNYFAALESEGNRLYQILLCKADHPEEVDAVAHRVRQLCLYATGRLGPSNGAGTGGTALGGAEPVGFERSGGSVDGTRWNDVDSSQLDPCPPLGWYSYLRGDWAAARHHLLGYLATHADDADPGIRGFAALLQFATGDFAGAKATLAVVPPFRPDHQSILHTVQISAYSMRADLCLREEDLDQALAWLTAADKFMEQRKGVTFRSGLRLAWARYYRTQHHLKLAYDQAEQALTYARNPKEFRFIIMASTLLGEIAAEMGDFVAAGRHLSDAIALAERCRYPYYAAVAKYDLGLVDPESRAAVDGMREAERTLSGLGVAPQEYNRLELALERGSVQGRRSAEGLADTVSAVGTIVGAEGASTEEVRLTQREMDVLGLVAKGLTDKQVAAALFISHRTVDNHLRNIFAKFGVTSRTQLVSYAATRGILPDHERSGTP